MITSIVPDSVPNFVLFVLLLNKALYVARIKSIFKKLLDMSHLFRAHK